MRKKDRGIAPDLGPFAPDTGPPNALARAAAVLGVATVLLAVIRPAAEVFGRTMSRWPGRIALPLGAVAVVCALVGAYQAGARSRRGRGLAMTGLWLALVGALVAFFFAAIRDGTFRPGEFYREFLNPTVMRAVAGDLMRGAVNTVKLAFLAQVSAILVGLVVATAVISRNKFLHFPALAYVDVVRGLPLVVLTILVYGGLPQLGITLAPFTAAVMILTINASAYIAEIFRAGIQSLARGQMDAARSLGMPYGPAMLSVILPQAIRAVIPPLMSEFIALIKDTALVMIIIGVTISSRDLWAAAQNDYASTFSFTPLMGAAIGYLIITIPLTRLVAILERRLRTGLA